MSTDQKPRKWAGLDVVVDKNVPPGVAEIRGKDGTIVAVLELSELQLDEDGED